MENRQAEQKQKCVFFSFHSSTLVLKTQIDIRSLLTQTRAHTQKLKRQQRKYHEISRKKNELKETNKKKCAKHAYNQLKKEENNRSDTEQKKKKTMKIFTSSIWLNQAVCKILNSMLSVPFLPRIPVLSFCKRYIWEKYVIILLKSSNVIRLNSNKRRIIIKGVETFSLALCIRLSEIRANSMKTIKKIFVEGKFWCRQMNIYAKFIFIYSCCLRYIYIFLQIIKWAKAKIKRMIEWKLCVPTEIGR